MTKTIALLGGCAVFLLLMTGCSSETPAPQAKKAEEKPPSR